MDGFSNKLIVKCATLCKYDVFFEYLKEIYLQNANVRLHIISTTGIAPCPTCTFLLCNRSAHSDSFDSVTD